MVLRVKLSRKQQVALVLLTVALVVAGYGYWLLVGPKNITQLSKTVSVQRLDFAACRSGEKYAQNEALGSSSATTLKSEGDYCLTEVSREIEGGYNTFECLVPKSAGLFQKEYPAELLAKGYQCKEIRSGNLLLERQ